MTTPVADFATLGVPTAMVDALERAGITQPFDIQLATIPDAIAGRDVLGRAPTGSGKTLAFGVPLLSRLGRSDSRRPRGLILSPTRELAEQIRRELEPLASAMDRKVLAVYGGVGLGPQAKALRRGIDLLVACPGRLQDLIDRGEVSLDRVDHVVVDEADRMADMGFLPAVRSLLDLCSTDRQTVLFSATLDRDVKILIDNYQDDPIKHEVGQVEPDLSTVDHRFISTEKNTKIGLAADLIDEAGPTMVFCRTRHGVDRVARQLKRAGVKAGWIHGGRSQNQRDAALSAFTTGRVKALVATDVAARGIHVDGVACVIHFDPPADNKDYVHRSGRTARAGAGGVVISLVNTDQRHAVKKLQRSVGLPKTDLEPTPELQHREAPAWVDERPERNRSSKGRRSGSRSQGDARGDRPHRNPRPKKAAHTSSDTRSTDTRANNASSNTGTSSEVAQTRSNRSKPPTRSKPSRSNNGEPRRKNRDSARSENRDRTEGQRPNRSKPKPKAGASSGGDPKRESKNGGAAGNGSGPKRPRGKKAPKRSGRARAKTHKQTRRANS